MRDKDVNVLKTLYGAIWKTEELMKEDMSELAIFDKGEEDEPVFYEILERCEALRDSIGKLTRKYGKKEEK